MNLDYGTPLKHRPGKLCVTHHHACACREEYLESLVDENQMLRDKIDELVLAYCRNTITPSDQDRDRVFAELQEAIVSLTKRVQAAEKLLVGFTAHDLCGNEVWALQTIHRELREFWGEKYHEPYLEN